MSALGLFAPRRLFQLARGDAMNIARDPMLAFAGFMSLAPSIAFYFGQQPMDAAAEAAFGVVALSRYIAPVALLMPAFLIGWVTGFLLLEDRDEGTLLAVDVTPTGKSGFLAYRVAVTAVLAILVTAFALPLIVPGLPLWLALCIIVLVALNAVAGAMVLPVLARNKVEGLALTKLTNLAALVPLVAIIPSPLRYIAGIVPTYWIGEVLGLSTVAVAPLWLSIAMAFLVSVLLVFGLFRMLAQRAG